MLFNDEQLLRYSRQILVQDFDIAGQQALAKARVLIVGVGGLGCPSALYLAAAGVGHLYLADDDEVDLSNLQRQILFTQAQLQNSKVSAAKQSLSAINSHIQVTSLKQRADATLIDSLKASADVVLDCSDNAATRLMLNRSCFEAKLPLVSGAAIRWEGQLTSFDFRQGQGPCYQCLFGDISDSDMNCSENGIISPVVGIIGVSQALEAIKIISQVGTTSFNTLRCFDGFTGQWRNLQYKQNPQCEICS